MKAIDIGLLTLGVDVAVLAGTAVDVDGTVVDVTVGTVVAVGVNAVHKTSLIGLLGINEGTPAQVSRKSSPPCIATIVGVALGIDTAKSARVRGTLLEKPVRPKNTNTARTAMAIARIIIRLLVKENRFNGIVPLQVFQ
jgi:hypothetical protein